jgi:hypothetical protein
VGSDAQISPPPRPFDRQLAMNSPVEPNRSLALSNDAGETLGNTTNLTERLNMTSDRTNQAGVVPQTRFASPAVHMRELQSSLRLFPMKQINS